MSSIKDGWTKAAHDRPLFHDSRDSASLPTPRDQGEGAKNTDRQGHEKAFERSERLDAEHKGVRVDPSDEKGIERDKPEWVEGSKYSTPKRHV
jgi:hypothetical protein